MIFGSVSKSHVLFGAKGRNRLETSSCCTVWREQDLPRGGWRQTQKSRTVWRELFLQIWRRTVWRGVISLRAIREHVWYHWAPNPSSCVAATRNSSLLHSCAFAALFHDCSDATWEFAKAPSKSRGCCRVRRLLFGARPVFGGWQKESHLWSKAK